MASPWPARLASRRPIRLPGGKVKYYRNPMGAADTSPIPKKDSMNMDYIPVCGDAAGEAPGTVKVSLDKVQRLGVRTEEVQQRTLSRTVRAFASLQFDERRLFVVAPKFSGWIEKLAVNATGDTVTVGQDLFDVYSPELNILQQQWRVAGRSAERHRQVAVSRLSRTRPRKAAPRGPALAHRHLSVAGSRNGDRQDRCRRHAFPAGRCAVPYRRHLQHVGDGRGLRAGSRLRESRRRRRDHGQRLARP